MNDMQPIRIRSQQQRDFAKQKIDSIGDDDGIVVKFGVYRKDRSAAQNALYYRWVGDINKQRDDETNASIRWELKLDYGVPILLESDDDFNEFWHNNGFYRLNREANLKNMKYTPVTSLMKVKPFALFLNEVEMLAKQEGWRLTYPDDIYSEAMGRAA